MIDLHDRLLTTTELADYLGVPTRWVYAHKHLLPVFRVGREMRFRTSEVDAWLEERRENQRYGLRVS